MEMIKLVITDESRIACCGIYCPACNKFLKSKCSGCQVDAQTKNCQVKQCCVSKGNHTCADCKEIKNIKTCKKFTNSYSKISGYIQNCDRIADINMVKTFGKQNYAMIMAKNEKRTINYY